MGEYLINTRMTDRQTRNRVFHITNFYWGHQNPIFKPLPQYFCGGSLISANYVDDYDDYMMTIDYNKLSLVHYILSTPAGDVWPAHTVLLKDQSRSGESSLFVGR